MTTVDATRPVTGGVDTHLDVNVAAALDAIGGLLGVAEFPTTPAGHRCLAEFLASFGTLTRVGVEGTGSVASHQLFDLSWPEPSMNLLSGTGACFWGTFGDHFCKVPKTFSLFVGVRVTSDELHSPEVPANRRGASVY